MKHFFGIKLIGVMTDSPRYGVKHFVGIKLIGVMTDSPRYGVKHFVGIKLPLSLVHVVMV